MVLKEGKRRATPEPPPLAAYTIIRGLGPSNSIESSQPLNPQLKATI